MLSVVIVFIVILIVPFAYVLLRGAPYLPTKKKQVEAALDLLDLNPGELLLDLGSGDGTVLIAASKRGLRVVGYELNPFLVLISKWRTRNIDNVTVKLANMWRQKLPEETAGIFVFLIDNFMDKLDKKIKSEKGKNKIKLASYSFVIEGKKPTRTKDNVKLYVY